MNTKCSVALDVASAHKLAAATSVRKFSPSPALEAWDVAPPPVEGFLHILHGSNISNHHFLI